MSSTKPPPLELFPFFYFSAVKYHLHITTTTTTTTTVRSNRLRISWYSQGFEECGRAANSWEGRGKKKKKRAIGQIHPAATPARSCPSSSQHKHWACYEPELTPGLMHQCTPHKAHDSSSANGSNRIAAKQIWRVTLSWLRGVSAKHINAHTRTHWRCWMLKPECLSPRR